MENKKFTKDDLKVGYVVKMANSDKLYMVAVNSRGEMGFVNANQGWMRFCDYTYTLEDKDPNSLSGDWTIVAVYGYSRHIITAYTFDTHHRELLWKREEAKKMTVEEIEKELGYKIEIVS